MNIFKGMMEFIMDILETVVFMGAMFIVIYLYVFQPNQVRGSSMLPTFEDKDYIFTSRLAYKLGEPKRGDVVVFRSPQNPDIEYIKRVVGIEGDKIKFTDCSLPNNVDCTVVVNGQPISEGYIKAKTQLFDNSMVAPDQEITVPQKMLFVMGDNRPGSLDSRIFGPVDQDSIIGVVIVRYLPANKMGLIKNPFTTE